MQILADKRITKLDFGILIQKKNCIHPWIEHRLAASLVATVVL